MKFVVCTALMTATPLLMADTAAPGHATTQLVAASSTFQPGATVQAAVRMNYEPGWHGYWINPGETGIKTEISWQLPAGWSADEPMFPVPHRRQDQLVSYGYEGEIWILVTLHVPAGETAKQVTLQGMVKWLACNEKSCVPGKAELKLELRQGSIQPGPEARDIARATAASAELLREVAWNWQEQDGKITIDIPNAAERSWQDAELFAATENWISPLQPLRLQRHEQGWRAVVDRSEYMNQRPPTVELWIVPREGRAARLQK